MLLALMLLQAGPQARFDTTVAVDPKTRLEVVATAGSIDIRVWDQNAVHIVARPQRGAVVRAELTGAVLRVQATTPGSGIDLVAYEITVPRAMALSLGRRDVDITVQGSEGAIEATITSGRITIEGGRGAVNLRSFDGAITLRGARATVKVESTMGVVRLAGVTGDVDVTSNSNHVTLDSVDSRNLRAVSTSGVIRFSGPLYQDGHYALIAHSGSVFVRTPAPINATLSAATVDGAFASPLPYTIIERQRRGIFTARFGNGGAQLIMESWSGSLVLDAIRP